MKLVPRLTLAAAVAAALLAPALLPAECPAQEKPVPAKSDDPPPVRRTERIYDVAGIRTPNLPSLVPEEERDHLRPFGLSPGLYAAVAGEELAAPEVRPQAEEIGEFVRGCLPEPIAGEVTSIASVWNGAALRVVTTAEGQKLVAAAIESLRRAAAPYQFDVRALSLRDDADSAAILAEVDRLGSAPLPATLAERLLSADAHGGLRGGTVTSYGGVTTHLDRIDQRSVVAEWNVEIAQAASIADPVPAMVEDGLRALLSATQSSDGTRTLVRFSATCGELQRPIRRVEMRTKDLGAVEMPEVRAGFVSTEWMTKPGQTTAIVLASPVSASGGTPVGVREVLLVRLVSAPSQPEPGAVAIVPVGCLAASPDEAVLVAPALDPGGADLRGCLGTWWQATAARYDAESLAKVVRAADPAAGEANWNVVSAASNWLGAGSLTVTGTEAFRGSARTLVAAAESDLLRDAHVSVRLAARDAAGTSERTLGLLSAPAMTGRNLALAAYTSIPYVGDYDVEVAQEARIADPRMLVALGGLVLNVRLSQGPADGWRADVDLTASSVGAVEAAPVSAAEVGVIERCPIQRTQAKQPVLLENGKTKEIDLGRNPWGAGRLVAVIRVDR